MKKLSNFAAHRVFKKIEKVFDYINSELIGKQHIKRMDVLKFFQKSLTHTSTHFGSL